MESNNPLITIITVVYNGEKYLEETILSVINQTYNNIEYIIIDGGSTDGTIDIIKKYEDRIDYWISEKDSGIYDAMNKGIAHSNGELINFMNASDVFCDSELLYNMVSHINKNEVFPDILYGNAHIYSENGDFLKVLKPLKFSKLFFNLFSTRVVCHQAVFVNRDIISTFDTDYIIKGDLNWYYSLLKKSKHSKIIYLPLSVCNYSLGGLSSKSSKIKNSMEQMKVMFNNNNFLIFLLSLPFPLIFLPFLMKLKNGVSSLKLLFQGLK